MKTLIKIVLFLIALAIVVPVLLFQYFFNSGPRDLGVKYTDADRVTAYANNGVESLAITPSQENKTGIKYEGKKDIKTSFTSEQITALNNSVKWVNYPVSHVQIKINSDGTGEASGVLDVKKILNWISFTHPIAEIESKVNEYKIGFTPAFYLKGKVTVINNKVSLASQTIEVGRLVIPQNIVSQNLRPVEKFIEDRINYIPNFYVKSLSLDGGKVNFDATVPEKQYSVQQ